MAEPTPRVGFFVATHKPWPLPENPRYRPIGLGGYRPQGRVDALTDEEGDSIAARNPYYSELTAWYWIWKNMRGLDVVGLCHYRRYYLLYPDHPYFHEPKILMAPTPVNLAGLCAAPLEPFLRPMMRDGTVVVPRPTEFPMSVADQYTHCHRQTDWAAFQQAIAETSPAHARRLDNFDRARTLSLYNMMIAPWTFFDDYMATLMAVLEKTETLIDYPDDPYQKRIPAFLAERFFNLHLAVTQPKRIEVPVVVTDPRAG